LVLYVIGWVAGCVGVFVMADRKGKSGLTWFFISLIFSPLTGFGFVAAMDPDQHVLNARAEKDKEASRAKAFRKGDLKECSQCGAVAERQADHCASCGLGFPIESM
jgi:hypothetical protein